MTLAEQVDDARMQLTDGMSKGGMQRARGDEKTILIIDDSVETIQLLSVMLRDQAKIFFATNGKMGIDMARQKRPEVILLDVEMKNMDGFEVCRQLKADVDLCSCAIIFVTAQSAVENEIACLEAGAVDFISKPLNAPVVSARVRTHLRLQSALLALEQLSIKDGLTGLFNRRYFDEQLAIEFARHRRQRVPLGLAFIDVDCFKLFNDHYGHQAGDFCLKEIARAIQQGTKRPAELVARYGGEEFVVILPNTDESALLDYGKWMCACVAELKMEHATSFAADRVTISVGLCAIVPDQYRSVLDLIGSADKALFLAKKQGRNRAVLLEAG